MMTEKDWGSLSLTPEAIENRLQRLEAAAELSAKQAAKISHLESELRQVRAELRSSLIKKY